MKARTLFSAGLCLLALGGGSSAYGQTKAPVHLDLSAISVKEDHVEGRLSDGTSAVLTLEVALQQQVQRLLRQAMPTRGAAVAVDVPSAKILAWGEKKHHAAEPSLHLSATAPAASVFKIVTASALIEQARLSPAFSVCWEGGDHGIWARHLESASGPDARCGPFSKALGYSRNAVYAYLAARFLGPQQLRDTAEQFGFNQPLRFEAEVPVGNSELLDDPLEFARGAAGFHGSTLTPLGAAHLAYVVANKGRSAAFRIVEDAPGYERPYPRKAGERVIKATTAWEVMRMMEVTVSGGTSLSAFSDEHGGNYLGSIRVAGKTGTLKTPHDATTTSWFVGFAPSRNPRLVVSVVLQNGKVWHRRANEVARDIFRSYFSARGAKAVSAP